MKLLRSACLAPPHIPRWGGPYARRLCGGPREAPRPRGAPPIEPFAWSFLWIASDGHPASAVFAWRRPQRETPYDNAHVVLPQQQQAAASSSNSSNSRNSIRSNDKNNRSRSRSSSSSSKVSSNKRPSPAAGRTARIADVSLCSVD
ncbi:hypothetical protein ACSSS7_008143 [Eimeria intestinalis]